MIQVVGLLMAGAAAAGLLLADTVTLLLSCWILGLVLHAGLIASGRGVRAAGTAREVFLTECAGTCVLAVAGLALIQLADSSRLDDLAHRLSLLDPRTGAVAWAGVGVLLAVACRLGLPPLPWGPARVIAAPPAVRVVLLGSLHPATAIVLWQRLEAWLQPGHLTAAAWLGGAVSLLLMLAAAGERHAVRRLGWLGAGHWAGLLVAGGQPAGAVWLLAGGMALLHLQAVRARAATSWQRVLLVGGGAAVLSAGAVSGLLEHGDAPGFLRQAAAVLTVVVLARWWRDAVRAPASPPPTGLRRPAFAVAAPLARSAQGGGPLPTLVTGTVGGLGQAAAVFDRVVLAGIADGLGWFALGLGWLAAWLDRRGQDAVYGGAASLLRLAGASTERLAAGRPHRVLFVALLVILALTLLGWAAARSS